MGCIAICGPGFFFKIKQQSRLISPLIAHIPSFFVFVFYSWSVVRRWPASSRRCACMCDSACCAPFHVCVIDDGTGLASHARILPSIEAPYARVLFVFVCVFFLIFLSYILLTLLHFSLPLSLPHYNLSLPFVFEFDTSYKFHISFLLFIFFFFILVGIAVSCAECLRGGQGLVLHHVVHVEHLVDNVAAQGARRS